ncbi:S-adenosyl-L-methionine-dependent methyltransferase [Morchella snyderi]|nr:S-adenosyl-L-methionine-dependent methyltransferase [Morchella snyderi]
MLGGPRGTELLKENEDASTVFDQVVGVDGLENNGGYVTDNPSETNSLDPEVKQYRYENGRSEGLYWAPNDDKQNEQLDIFHHVYILVLDGALYLAPIDENPERVLDLGTGTGIWAIDIADKFPNTKVIGNDLSPIQPTCWSCLYKEAYAALKPGGWFESVETAIEFYIDDNEGRPTATIDSTTSISQWCRLGIEASEKAGRPFDITDKLKGWMEDALFINVEESIFKVPIGSWPKDPKMKNIGRYNLLNLLEALEGFTLALFTRFLDWTADEVYVLLAGVRSELRSRNNNFYYKMLYPNDECSNYY